MRKLITLCLVTAILSWGGQASAQSVDMSPQAKLAIQQARQDCQSFENGTLKLGENVVSRVDITGDGQLDEVVDFGKLSCSTAASLFCGTGGCSLSVITAGKATEFLAKAWNVFVWDNQPILMLVVHGSECGGINLRRCYRATVWTEKGFSTVGGL